MKKSVFGIISTVAISFPVEFTKMHHKKVKDDAIKDKIMEQGLYHFTSQAGQKAILESGYIKPSGLMTSHFTRPKSYMFCGIPSIDILRKNISNDKNPFLNEIYEFNVVHIKPTKEQVKDFKVRNLNDNAIVKDGKYILPENTLEYIEAEDKIIQEGSFNQNLVLNLDENGKIILEVFDLSKHDYEIVNDEEGKCILKYKPSEKLKQVMEKERANNNVIKENFTQLEIEKQTFITKFKETFGRIFNRNKDVKMLGAANRSEEYQNDIQNNLSEKLKEFTYGINEIPESNVRDDIEQTREEKEIII